MNLSGVLAPCLLLLNSILLPAVASPAGFSHYPLSLGNLLAPRDDQCQVREHISQNIAVPNVHTLQSIICDPRQNLDDNGHLDPNRYADLHCAEAGKNYGLQCTTCLQDGAVPGSGKCGGHDPNNPTPNNNNPGLDQMLGAGSSGSSSDATCPSTQYEPNVCDGKQPSGCISALLGIFGCKGCLQNSLGLAPNCAACSNPSLVFPNCGGKPCFQPEDPDCGENNRTQNYAPDPIGPPTVGDGGNPLGGRVNDTAAVNTDATAIADGYADFFKPGKHMCLQILMTISTDFWFQSSHWIPRLRYRPCLGWLPGL